MRCEKVLLQEQQGMGDYIHLTSCNEKMSLIFSLFRERGLSHKSDNVILVPKNEKLVSSFSKLH